MGRVHNARGPTHLYNLWKGLGGREDREKKGGRRWPNHFLPPLFSVRSEWGGGKEKGPRGRGRWGRAPLTVCTPTTII